MQCTMIMTDNMAVEIKLWLRKKRVLPKKQNQQLVKLIYTFDMHKETMENFNH